MNYIEMPYFYYFCSQIQSLAFVYNVSTVGSVHHPMALLTVTALVDGLGTDVNMVNEKTLINFF